MAAAGGTPPSPQMQAAMQQLWTQTVDRVKRDVISPSLWRALERTLPVVFEDNVFAVGLQAGDGQLAGTMNTGEYKSAIERAMRAITGDNALTFRVIEGTSYADWEYAKARDAAAASQQRQATQKRTVEAAGFASWDEIYDQVSRLWANSEYRALASGKARFIELALAHVQKAMETLMPEGGKTNEQTERGLSRVIERIASMTGSDATLVACLLFQRHGAGKASSGGSGGDAA